MLLLPEDHENVKQFQVETRARRKAPLSNAEHPVLDLEKEVAKVRGVGVDARHIGRAQRILAYADSCRDHGVRGAAGTAISLAPTPWRVTPARNPGKRGRIIYCAQIEDRLMQSRTASAHSSGMPRVGPTASRARAPPGPRKAKRWRLSCRLIKRTNVGPRLFACKSS